MSTGFSEAWVTFVADDEGSTDAIVLAKSLRLSCTSKKIVAVVHFKTSCVLRKMMRDVFDLLLVLPAERDHPLTSVLNTSAQIYCLSLTFFRKIIFLDSKCMVLKNCDNLFDMESVVIGYTNDVEDLAVDVYGFSPSLDLYLDIIRTGWHQSASIYITVDHMTKSFWSYIKLNCNPIILDSDFTFLLNVDTQVMDIQLTELPNIVKILCEEKEMKARIIRTNHLYKEIMNCRNYLAKEITSLYPNPFHLVVGNNDRGQVAIIGMSCRLPRANNVDEFWNLLVNKEDGMQTIPDTRWTKEQSCNTDERLRKMQVGFLKCPIDEFDAEFFNISPMELSYTDPQQRLLLEVSYEALEDAGIDPMSLRASQTGVFNGIWTNEYKELMIESGFKGNEFYRAYMGNAFGASSGKIAHFLGVSGPNITVESGCSSSLVATGLACESLRNGTSNVALACGVNLILRPFHYETTPHIHSPTCHSRPFDAAANGYGRSEGVVVIVMKRLSDAVRDRDSIYGIIKGYGTAQEGLSTSSGTPTISCEATAMQMALKDANLQPNDIDYLEAHSTGTVVGDPIEFNAISQVYSTERVEPLIIGALKSNIGHTESCSGLAAVVKTLLAMEKQIIPPMLEIKTINPNIQPENIPAVLSLESIKWPKSTTKIRTAGINNFGITGTDSHLILEESPETSNCIFKSGLTHSLHILTISAKTNTALNELVNKYDKYLSSSSYSLDDFAYTANTGRAHYEERIAVVGSDTSDVLYNIRHQKYERKTTSKSLPTLCFLFSGQGSQYLGMGKQLYKICPNFRKNFDLCDTLLQNYHSISIKEVIWSDDEKQLHDSLYSQTAIFVIEYCITELWKSWGITPDIVIGHSLGEFAAATAAGYLDLQTAIHLVATRAKLICKLVEGKMIAIKYNADQIFELLKDFYKNNPQTWLDVAAINSKVQTTLAGRSETVVKFKEFCKLNKIQAHILNSVHAYHSRDMDAVLKKFSETERLINYGKPLCRYVSGFTGELMGNELDKDYWVRQTREPVRFTKASTCLQNLGCTTFVEVGPQAVLSAFISLNLDANNSLTINCWPSIFKMRNEWNTMLTALAKLYTSGFVVNWKGFYKSQTLKKLRLPFYPFQRQKYWFNISTILDTNNVKEIHPLLGSRFSAPKHLQIFEKRFTESTISYLIDHKINNYTVFPGSGYLEIIIAAGMLLQSEMFNESDSDETCLKVQDFEISSPLEVFKDKLSKLQTSVLFVNDEHNCLKQLKIAIHSQTIGQAESSWTNNAEATICRDKSSSYLPIVANVDLATNQKETLSHTQIYTQFSSLGYNFGKTFQSIARYWILSQKDVFAEIILQDVENDQYQYHPILLDAMIQVYLLSSFEIVTALYIPTAIKRLLCFRPPVGNKYYISASKTLQEVFLYNSDGEPVAQMNGVVLVRTTIENVLKSLGHTNNLMPEMYEENWIEAGVYYSNETFENTTNMPSIVVSEANDFNSSSELVDDLKKLEAIISFGIARSFHQLECQMFKLHNKFTVDDVMDSTCTIKDFRNTIKRFLEILAEDGYLKASEWFKDSFVVVKELPSVQEASYKIDEAFKHKKQLPVIWKFVRYYLENMSNIMSGKMPILRALFPENKTDGSVEIMYNKAENFHFGNIILLEKLIKIAANIGQKQSRIRILEIGAGTASTAKMVVPKLAEMDIDFVYEFTDISASFFSQAEKYLSENREKILFKVLNIEEDPKMQGFCPHSYDIIIAANVLHATKNLVTSVKNVRHLLKNCGWLLLSETFIPQRHYDISVGYLDGFWQFTDFDLRENSCMINHTQWEELLCRLDFEFAKTTGTFENRFGVVMAKASALTPLYYHPSRISSNRPWIIFSSESELFNELIGHLRLAGEHVIVISNYINFKRKADCEFGLNPNNKEDFNLFFDYLETAKCNLQGIIYGWGMNNKLNADEISKAFLYIIQSLTASMHRKVPSIFILTTGLAYISDESVSIPDSAPLIGFSRTYRAEYPTTFCKNIDLPVESSVENFLPQFILQELWTDSKEPIVAIRRGKRYVARLNHLISESRYPSLQLPQTNCFILDTSQTTSIADLKFKAHTQKQTNSNEIRILIKAAGLNFRDVVTTIRATEELTIAIGGDFSGIIIAVGSNVKSRNIGDAVAGVNWNCEPLPSHVTVNEDEVWALPPTMTFAEAATLGVPFFTAFHCLVTLGQLKASETILIHSGAGGVGLCAVQIAKNIGASIIATAGSPRKRSYLRSIGVTEVHNSRNLLYGKKIQTQTNGKGVDMVLNSLTGTGFKETSLKCCGKFARFIEMSKLNIWTTEEVKSLRPDVKYILDDITLFDKNERRFFIKKLQKFVSSKQIFPLPYTLFEATDIRQALAHFSKPEHIGKIVCTMPCNTSPNGIPVYAQELFNDRSTYLVTGGLQGVGLAVAKWMTTLGAKNIVLCGRNPPTDSNSQQVLKLNKTGKNVIMQQVNVSFMKEIKTLIDSINNGTLQLPPLRGVMHAAGSLADEIIPSQNWGKFETTFQAKVKGSWNLHELTKNLNLEHFVLFSTVSAVLGRHGQSNHTAANSFMDGLAKYRHSIGLPATSINWGQWGEDGIAVNMKLRAVTPFSTAKGTSAIAHIMKHHYINVVASDGDLDIWLEISPWAKLYLNKLNRNSANVTPKNKLEISAETFKNELKFFRIPDEIKSKIQFFVAGIICEILEIRNQETFKDCTNLQDIGLDSLMKIQLKNNIQKLLGSEYNFTLSMLTECLTMKMITEKIYSIIYNSEEPNESERIRNKAELIKKDCILWEHIKQNDYLSCKEEANIQVILLTGVTGNLGPYVLQKLSKMPQITTVYCLIRQTDTLTCDERLKNHLTEISMINGIDMSKVFVVNGNVMQPNLGMTIHEFERLAAEVHAVIHLAVASNHLEEYEMGTSKEANLRENNVIGTQRILEFVVAKTTKFLFHASTIATMWRADENGSLPERWPAADEYEDAPKFGYGLSKHVSDHIISQAVDQEGIPCKVFRFPLIVGEAKTGKQIVEKNHFFLRYLSYIHCRQIPDIDVPLNILPVDICAEISIDLFFDKKTTPGIYNLFNPVTRNEKEIINLAKEMGYPIELVEYNDFLKSTMNNKSSIIYDFLEFYEDKERFLKLINIDICQKWKNQSTPVNYFRSKKIEKLIPERYLNIEDPLIYLKRCIFYAQNNYKLTI